MSGHGEKLGRKKEAAIAALLTQRSIEDAARAVTISGKTLRRWMKLPEFQVEYLQARRDVLLQTNARIQQNSGAAASVQLKLMADPNTPASVRARTSQFLLEYASTSLEQEDVLVRLAALERAEEDRKNKR
jgi:hypothetical protein